jgi:MraZ protein
MMGKSGGKWRKGDFLPGAGAGVFRGVNKLAVDSKGRFAMPTKYREALGASCAAQLVVTIDTDRCLLIYPLPEWQEIERKLMQLPSFNKTARRLQRLLVGHATEVELDGQGRLLLPPPLREFAGIEKQAVLIGQGNKFELWDEGRWDAQRDEWLQEVDFDALELPAGLETLSI